MHILMDYMTNKHNQFPQKCLIGPGIILNPLKNYYRQWYMKKVFFTIQMLNKLNKLFNLQSQNPKPLKILDMEQNIGYINEECIKNVD